MGKTSVVAWDTSARLAGDVTGRSGRTGENSTGLERFKTKFFNSLIQVEKREDWPVFGCAEVNAVYLLAVFRDARLADVRIQKAIDGNLLKNPCRNCSQWLEQIGNSREYRIAAEFTFSDADEGVSRVPKNSPSDKSLFPALPTPSASIGK